MEERQIYVSKLHPNGVGQEQRARILLKGGSFSATLAAFESKEVSMSILEADPAFHSVLLYNNLHIWPTGMDLAASVIDNPVVQVFA